MNSLARFLRSPWLAVRVQIGLGIIFVVAAWPKLVDPPAFAKNIWAYAMLPDWGVNLSSLILPGIELVVGLALILSWRPAAAAWIAGALLALFIVALFYNAYITENPVNCSCFELNPVLKTCSQLLSEMKALILRDIGMMLMAAHVIWWRRSVGAEPVTSSPHASM